MVTVQRIAAFSHKGAGGNPAGVVLLDDGVVLEQAEMAAIAADVGFSETAFAAIDDTADSWRVRYFSPESEVPFCGHATIALGAALGERLGPGVYALELNDANIEVEAQADDDGVRATLTSPATRSRPTHATELHDALGLFGLLEDELDPRLPPARIHGGSDHLVLALTERERLREMAYDLDDGRAMMRSHGLVTIMLCVAESETTFVARNAFASGGVLEDPATGAAAAAFAGYLRDRGWPHHGRFVIRQGEDMGSPSRITVELSDEPGSPVRVSGRAHIIGDC